MVPRNISICVYIGRLRRRALRALYFLKTSRLNADNTTADLWGGVTCFCVLLQVIPKVCLVTVDHGAIIVCLVVIVVCDDQDYCRYPQARVVEGCKTVRRTTRWHYSACSVREEPHVPIRLEVEKALVGPKLKFVV